MAFTFFLFHTYFINLVLNLLILSDHLLLLVLDVISAKFRILLMSEVILSSFLVLSLALESGEEVVENDTFVLVGLRSSGGLLFGF